MGEFSSAHPCQGCNKALQSSTLSCLSSTSTAKPNSLSAFHFSLRQPKSAPDSVGLEQANELVIITPASLIQPQGPTVINDLDWNLGLTATFPKAHSSSCSQRSQVDSSEQQTRAHRSALPNTTELSAFSRGRGNQTKKAAQSQ